MHRKRVGVVAAAAIALMAGSTVLTPEAASAAEQRMPTVTVTLSAKSVKAVHTLHAGRTIFKVVATQGERELEIVRLSKGYTLAQADKDLDNLFSGNVATVKRVDSHIRFFGGSDSQPGHPTYFAETLYAGSYLLVDTDGPGRQVLHVTGTPPARNWVHVGSTVVGTRTDRFDMPSSIPHAGWTLFRDTSDEPHFLDLQQVKPGTTNAEVKQFLDSGNQGQPSFALGGQASSGVIAGGLQMLWNYNVPRGRYLVLCFWPSDETGMPHANMGMYKLVTLT